MRFGVRLPLIYNIYQRYYFYLSRIFFGVFYEPEFKKLEILAKRNEDGIAVDVGSNVGLSVISLNKALGVRRFICFEPNPELAQQAKDRFRRYPRLSVEINQTALGAAPKTCDLLIPIINGVKLHGRALISSIGEVDWNQTISKRYKESWERFVVSCVTLDSYDVSPYLIKIDVEGGELEVLEGSRETIKRAKPIIFIECTETFKEVSLILNEFGYSAFELVNGAWVQSQGKCKNQVFVTAMNLNSNFLN